MLTIYRRHQRQCEHRAEGRAYRRCHCVIWVDGTVRGEEIRKSLGTRNWEKAQDVVREWEAKGQSAGQVEQSQPIRVKEACDKFMADAEARELREPTLYKYRPLFRQLQSFAASDGIKYPCEFNLDCLRRFRATWPNRNIAARKKLEALKAFFRFCWESEWIPSNPATKLKPPKITDPPTLPFSREEVTRILAACDQYRGRGQRGRVNAERLRTLVQLLRFSGLRIRDAVTLPRERVVNGKLLLYTAKTGTPVYVPLPEFVIQQLEWSRGANPRYFFWSGEGKPKSCVGDWQRSLKKLFRLAGIPNGHAHRFRHTFATELLLAGVPLDRVATLLGHTNSKITEKHYAPWVRARQEQLEADVRKVWERLPEVSQGLTISGTRYLQ